MPGIRRADPTNTSVTVSLPVEQSGANTTFEQPALVSTCHVITTVTSCQHRSRRSRCAPALSTSSDNSSLLQVLSSTGRVSHADNPSPMPLPDTSPTLWKFRATAGVFHPSTATVDRWSSGATVGLEHRTAMAVDLDGVTTVLLLEPGSDNDYVRRAFSASLRRAVGDARSGHPGRLIDGATCRPPTPARDGPVVVGGVRLEPQWWRRRWNIPPVWSPSWPPCRARP